MKALVTVEATRLLAPPASVVDVPVEPRTPERETPRFFLLSRSSRLISCYKALPGQAFAPPPALADVYWAHREVVGSLTALRGMQNTISSAALARKDAWFLRLDVAGMSTAQLR
ncbi:hypothetical protein MIND_01347400 [Mycena indigotica]|uniref:Uncharacterized protein n=1 Tax=Mycena indigotica TaxID=2126181 RepID=A0A8H6RZD3_9AGAR|nr:uncharacterized protein MIND_01347400 [Mycena indigotica]KAF7289738.1 hypothetical protein MIND_01347400 [Mycena indigotica]